MGKKKQFPYPTFSWNIVKDKFLVSTTVFKPTVWKHYILIRSLSGIVVYFEQANLHKLKFIKFTADVSDTETWFLRNGYKYTKAQDSTKTMSSMLRH